MTLNVGDHIPTFKKKDVYGNELSSDHLIRKTVFFFFPKCETPGCTQEACDFRDHFSSFASESIHVVGVSPEDHATQLAFKLKHNLSCNFLSDENGDLCRAFQVLKDGKFTRTTFIVNNKGIVEWVESPVNINAHVNRVLDQINNLPF